MPRKGEIIDLRKMRYGKLTVMEYDGKHGRRHKWLCRCDCGNFVSVCRDHLINGHTRSCGCLAGENKCSEDDKRLNFVYRNLINRCYSKSCKEYPYYGARGIVICDEWKISDERGSGLNNFRKWSHDNGDNARCSCSVVSVSTCECLVLDIHVNCITTVIAFVLSIERRNIEHVQTTDK